MTRLLLFLLLVQAPDTANTSHPAPQLPDSAVAPPVLTRADSILEQRTKEVSATLRCPVCQGLSIQDSPAELARQMKNVVREQLRAGRTPAQVREYFVSKYGTSILLTPPAEGFNLLVYVLPAAALIFGAVFLVVLTRRWTRKTGQPPATPASRDGEEASALE